MKKGDRITIAELPACTIDRGIPGYGLLVTVV